MNIYEKVSIILSKTYDGNLLHINDRNIINRLINDPARLEGVAHLRALYDKLINRTYNFNYHMGFTDISKNKDNRLYYKKLLMDVMPKGYPLSKETQLTDRLYHIAKLHEVNHMPFTIRDYLKFKLEPLPYQMNSKLLDLHCKNVKYQFNTVIYYKENNLYHISLTHSEVKDLTLHEFRLTLIETRIYLPYFLQRDILSNKGYKNIQGKTLQYSLSLVNAEMATAK